MFPLAWTHSDIALELLLGLGIAQVGRASHSLHHKYLLTEVLHICLRPCACHLKEGICEVGELDQTQKGL